MPFNTRWLSVSSNLVWSTQLQAGQIDTMRSHHPKNTLEDVEELLRVKGLWNLSGAVSSLYDREAALMKSQ